MGRFDNFLKEKKVVEENSPLKPLWKCLVCEFIGTFLLIFVGCGSGLTLTAERVDERQLAGIALCWAFLIATLGQTLGTYSCDINPAVTLSFLTTGKTNIIRAALYVVVQCAGCTSGAAMLKAVTPDNVLGNFGITVVAENIGPWRGFLIETIITTFLALIVYSANDGGRKDLRGSIALSVGLGIGSIILFAAPFTGASMNPARSLGPSIVANHFDHHWVFWAGPILGAQIGAHLYQHILRARWPKNQEKEPHPAAV